MLGYTNHEVSKLLILYYGIVKWDFFNRMPPIFTILYAVF